MIILHTPYIAAASGYLVQDTFTDTNGVDLSAHTPDVDSVGSGWVDGTVTVEVQSNQAAGVNTSGIAWIDTGAADVVVEVDRFTDVTFRQFRVIGRLSDESNYLNAQIVAQGASPSTSAFLLRKVEAGSVTDLATGSYTVDYSTTYHVTLTCNGTSIEAQLDSETPLSATSSFNQAQTNCGLWFQRNPGASGGYADNFAVTAA